VRARRLATFRRLFDDISASTLFRTRASHRSRFIWTRRYLLRPAGNFRGVIMQIGSIVRSVHIAVPQGARGIVMRILGDMAMVAWYADEPGTSELLNTEPFFLEDLIDTGEQVRPANAPIH
jgi:hypothetical protein